MNMAADQYSLQSHCAADPLLTVCLGPNERASVLGHRVAVDLNYPELPRSDQYIQIQ